MGVRISFAALSNSSLTIAFLCLFLKLENKLLMAAEITCPNCNHNFTLNDVLSESLQKQLQEEKEKYRKDMLVWKESKEKEHELTIEKLKTAQSQQQKEWQTQIEQQLKQQLSNEYEVQLKLSQQQNKQQEVALQEARKKEFEFLTKEQELKNKEAALEIEIQKKLLAERDKLAQQIAKDEQAKIAQRETELNLKNQELEKQLEIQKKSAEEMQKRIEQGSMQMQGEILEIALETLLRNEFPFDTVQEVAKGVKGADCILTVRNKFGQECGSIIFESKRTKDFNKEWIEKLKSDRISQGADVAILVTQTLPKGSKSMSAIEDIWVCNFDDAAALTHLIRDGIIKVAIAQASQNNKGDKMHLLYDYLTSNEFTGQWNAIREGFLAMRNSIQKERVAMEQLWKAREKQLEKVLLNTSGIKGSIEGIAGNEQINFNLLSDESADLLP
jgi:hypothetical protein